jgi:hypothetical protein
MLGLAEMVRAGDVGLKIISMKYNEIFICKICNLWIVSADRRRKPMHHYHHSANGEL